MIQEGNILQEGMVKKHGSREVWAMGSFIVLVVFG